MSICDLQCEKAVSKIDFSQNVDSHRFVRRIFKIETTKHPRTLNQDLHLPRPNEELNETRYFALMKN